MKKKYQNTFFFFGITVLALMVAQLDFDETWRCLQHAGYWVVAVIALWFFLYLFNTSAWYIILRSTMRQHQNNLPADGTASKIGFWWLYKITVSGFAINYATPAGLMGGEPYRILSLAPKVGAECASASVLLYAMTHIFSHFWFWLVSVAIYIITHSVTVPIGIMLAIVTAFCLLAIWFFLKGYQHGFAVSCMDILSRAPIVKKRVQKFVDSHSTQLTEIDCQIAALHNENPRTFVSAVLLELACRILSALEIYFILLVINPEVNYIVCILILAFTSLFANILFFIPMQLGGREGGFLMSATGLGLTANGGIFVAFIVRIRELIWAAIGMILIKFDKKRA